MCISLLNLLTFREPAKFFGCEDPGSGNSVVTNDVIIRITRITCKLGRRSRKQLALSRKFSVLINILLASLANITFQVQSMVGIFLHLGNVV